MGTDPYDLRARAVYDNRRFPAPHQAKPRPRVQTPYTDLIDDFLTRPEGACHIVTADRCQLDSARVGLRRLIAREGLPLAVHADGHKMTLHINKEAI